MDGIRLRSPVISVPELVPSFTGFEPSFTGFQSPCLATTHSIRAVFLVVDTSLVSFLQPVLYSSSVPSSTRPHDY